MKIISLVEVNRLGLPLLSFEVVIFLFLMCVIVVTVYLKNGGFEFKNSKLESKLKVYKTLIAINDTKLEIEPGENKNIETDLFFFNLGDEQFSSEKMCTYAEYIFTKLKKGWIDRNIAKVTPFISESFLKKQKVELEKYEFKWQTENLKKIVVTSSYILNSYQIDNHDAVEVFIKAKFYDYAIKEKTEINAEKRKEVVCYRGYKMIFIRNKGLKTKEFIYDVNAVACPNCMASIDVLRESICEYCGSNVIYKVNEWILNNIEKVR